MRDPGAVLARTFDAFIEQFNTLPTDELHLPRQRFWHFGELAWDNEMFAVHADSIYQGLPGQQTPGYQIATGGIVMYAMDINVVIVREHPNVDNAGRPPMDVDLINAAARGAADAVALTNAYFGSVSDYSLVDQCDTQSFGGITWQGPEGGLGATVLTFSVQL